MQKNKRSEKRNDAYTPADILERSSRLSGAWLDKEVKKSFPRVFVPNEQSTKENKGEEAEDNKKE